ncbi:MAG: LLM class flavin-dependent oxidoreductase [Nitrososphaerota archaeon]|nr:LLM class flavin-dependent oxidoreductase [Nitrososphaerota archaeon]
MSARDRTNAVDAERVRFGIEAPNFPWSTILDLALAGEREGYDSFWMPDHSVATGTKRWDALEAWTTLASISSRTRRLRLATGVSDTYRSHPATLAQRAATLDAISDGRAMLGIGVGEAMNLVPFGIPYDRPVARTEEALEIIRRLWTEDNVDFKGAYYNLSGAFLQPKPSVPVSPDRYRPTVPIFVAASSPRTMQMTARFGDGWLPANMAIQDYGVNLQKIREMAGRAGRDPGAIEPAHFTYVALAKNRDEALKGVMTQAKMLLLSRPKILEELGFKPPSYDYEMTYKLVFPGGAKGWVAKALEIPDEAVTKSPYVIGGPDDVVEKLEGYVAAGCRHFVLNFQVPARALRDTAELFAEKVMPHFRGGGPEP